MRHTPNVQAERYRVAGPPNTNNGMFLLSVLKIRVSDGGGWDHVSVSLSNRCPTWEEMCRVKELFFRDDECAMQLHPPKSEYVNVHQFCLHLWRPQTAEEIAAVRVEWEREGEGWPYEDLQPAGEIPRPESMFV